MGQSVIVVPGLFGTSLATAPGLTQRRVWVSQVNQLLYGAAPFQLAEDGISPGPIASGPLSPDGMVDLGIYEPVVTALANAKYDPFFWPYDWRFSVRLQALAFANYLNVQHKAETFHVIAHSMGGLVALLAYPIFQAMQSTATWGKTVYVGCPFGGSYDAAAALGGINSPFDAYYYWYLWVTPSVGLITLNPGTVWAPKQLTQMVLASWPSIYELLPSSVGQFSGLDPNAQRLFVLANWAQANKWVTQARLDGAIATQDAIRAAIAGPRSAESFVVCQDLATRTALSATKSFDDGDAYAVTNSGDHVVTYERSQLQNNKDLIVTGDHTDMLRETDFLSRLESLLGNTITLPQTAAAPFKPGINPPSFQSTIEMPPPLWPTLQRRGDP